MTTLARYEPATNPAVPNMVERFLDGWANGRSEEGTLPVDIYETPDELVVRAMVPGFQREDIDIQVEKGILSLKADARTEPETHARYYRRELNWGSLSRRIALPGIVDDAHAAAELKNGILTLRIPIAEQAKPRRVEIKGD